VAANLQCLAPWLDSLPDPADIGSSLQSLRGSVDSVVAPQLANLSTALTGLTGALAPAPSPGTYTAAVQTIADAKALLVDAPDGLIPEGQAFAAAAEALDPAVEDPAGLAAARAALSALLTSPQPLAGKLAGMAALRGALGVLQSAGTSDSYVPDALAALSALRQVARDAADLASALRGVQANYTAVAPCMAALLQRAERVNSTVLVLPPAVAASVELLQVAEVRPAQGLQRVV